MMWPECVTKVVGGHDSHWLHVPASAWSQVHAQLRVAGFIRLEHLTVIDNAGLSVVSTLTDEAARQVVHVLSEATTQVESLSAMFVSATAHEREAGQMFGMVFTGLPDTRPLFADAAPGTPLLRRHALVDRRDRAWPGASDPGDAPRRRPAPVPGVLAEWQS